MFSSQGIFCFYVVFVGIWISGIQACFRINEHQNKSITTGSTFYQECECTEKGYTIKNVQWLDIHNQPIPLGPGTNIFTEELNESLNLHITSINKGMSGTYKCVTDVDGVRYTQSYTIEAYDPLYFYETPNNQFLIYEQESRIICQPKSDTLVYTSWLKEIGDSVLEITSDDKYQVEPDGLIIRQTSKEDAGVYVCQARAIATNDEVDRYIKVDVMTKPEILELRANPDATVIVGQNLTIDCIAGGFPHPEYFWNKTVEPAVQSKVNWRQDYNTIILDDVQAEDRGNYTCYVFNAAGLHKMDIFIDVLVPPKVTDFHNRTEIEGTTIQLFCNATGTPEPNITLSYAGNDPSINLIVERDHMPNGVLVSLDVSSEGIYFCNATNEVASTEVAMYLTVLHRPYFNTKEDFLWGWEGISVNLSCAQKSNPPALVTWRFQGSNITTDENIELNRKLAKFVESSPEDYFTLNIDNETAYGTFECSARNDFGEDTKRIILREGFRPDKIINANIIDLTATSVTFSIYGPEEVNGPEVQGYTAQYDESKNYNITDIHINRTWSTSRPYKLDKLKPNTSYDVKFAAVNQVGTSDWSASINFVTENKSVPEPPEWFDNPIVQTSKSHVLQWKAPDDNGEPIDYYQLRYCPDSSEEECKSHKMSPTTSLELSDLKFNTTYFLELIAHNKEGDSMAANITVYVEVPEFLESQSTTMLSGGAIIAIAIVIVVICLLLLDVILLVWRRQGIIASCCYKKNNKRKGDGLNPRDKKGLLTPVEPRPEIRPDNGHKEFEYNKTTGIVTGKHSAV